jgi:hypothetical protein
MRPNSLPARVPKCYNVPTERDEGHASQGVAVVEESL